MKPKGFSRTFSALGFCFNLQTFQDFLRAVKTLKTLYFDLINFNSSSILKSLTVPYYMKFWRHFNLANLAISVAKFRSSLKQSEYIYNMKFCHLVNFTRSCYFTVHYNVIRISTCIHFSHFSFTTEMDSSLVLNFAFPCGLRGFPRL